MGSALRERCGSGYSCRYLECKKQNSIGPLQQRWGEERRKCMWTARE